LATGYIATIEDVKDGLTDLSTFSDSDTP